MGLRSQILLVSFLLSFLLSFLGTLLVTPPVHGQTLPLEGVRLSFLMGPLYRDDIVGTGRLSGVTIVYKTGISLEARVTTPVLLKRYVRLGGSLGFDFAQIESMRVLNGEDLVEARFPGLSDDLVTAAANSVRTTAGGQHMVFSMLLRGDFEYPDLPLIPYVGGGFGWAFTDGRRIPQFTLRTLGLSEKLLGLGPSVRLTATVETGLRWRWEQKVILDMGYHFSWVDKDTQGQGEGQGEFRSHKFRVAFTFAL